jgi:hypothetical protein
MSVWESVYGKFVYTMFGRCGNGVDYEERTGIVYGGSDVFCYDGVRRERDSGHDGRGDADGWRICGYHHDEI